MHRIACWNWKRETPSWATVTTRSTNSWTRCWKVCQLLYASMLVGVLWLLVMLDCLYTFFQYQHVTRRQCIALGWDMYSYTHCFVHLWIPLRSTTRRQQQRAPESIDERFVVEFRTKKPSQCWFETHVWRKGEPKKKKDHGKARAYIDDINQGEWVCESSFSRTKEWSMEFSNLYAADGVKKMVVGVVRKKKQGVPYLLQSAVKKNYNCTTITTLNKFKNPGRVLCVCVPVPFQIIYK